MKIGSAVAFTALLAIAQPPPQMSPTFLKSPADWRFERMPVPPGFAPDVKFSGFEEARFAPGMFDNTSQTYLTYVLSLSLDGPPQIDPPALKDFLEKYYRGLSLVLASRKGQSPDPAQMTADVTATASGFNAKVIFFDSFTDGRKVALNLEIREVKRPAVARTGLVILISPQPTDHQVWQKLREIGAQITF
jgi:hypothetical protein